MNESVVQEVVPTEAQENEEVIVENEEVNMGESQENEEVCGDDSMSYK